jgi:hypothetical protein
MDGYASSELEEEDGPAFTKGMIRQLRIKINEINNEENYRNILLMVWWQPACMQRVMTTQPKVRLYPLINCDQLAR